MFRQTQTPPQSRSQSRPGGLQTEKTTSLENSQPLETSDSQSATEEPSASLDKMEDDDQSSTTSSLEIVDALTEAAEDLTSRFEDADRSSSSPSLPMDLVLVGLPSEEGGLQGGLNFSQDQMTASQYSQVVFHDVADTYPSECDIHCRYTLTRGLQAGHGDRVALYRLPYLQPHEYITFVWAPVPPTVETLENSSELEVTFALSSLPAEDDFYQFQYLQGDSIVAGASVPFQLRGQGAGKLCSDIKSDEIQVMCDVDTRDLTKDSLDGKVVSMESKYSDLLALSEQLSEELSQKQQSFVILEMEHKSMLEVATRAKELEADMRSLVEEKLGLEQTLEQTNETLHQGESLLSTTTTRMTEAKDLLKMKVEQVLVLEEALARSEAKCGAASSDIQALVEERDKLAVMLQKEIESREVLLQQKTELVERLEDTGNMLNAASKSKDLAVEEIRCQVQLQDRIRKELAVAREEAGVAEADLVTVRQELDRCKKELQLVSEGQKEEVKGSQGDEVKGSQGEEVRGDDRDSDSLAVASVLSGLGARLEAKERELRQKEEELQLLRQVEGQSVEIHEKCLEDADKRALEQENENKQLVADIGRLGEKLRGVEEENLDLRRRLEAGAKHYRKLAQDKERLEKEMEGEEVDGLKSKISELEAEVSQLRLEQQGASCNSQASSMTRAWTGLMDHQVVNSGSQASSMTRAWTGLGMSDGESINNMDSIKINEAVTSGSGDRLPSLLHPARPTAPVTVQPMAAPLPCPLVPDNVDPTILPPELRPRAPAPYSLSSCRSNDVSDGGSLTGSEPASQTITEPVSPAVSQPGSMVTELENQTIPVEDVVIAPDEDKCPLCDLVLPLGSVMEQHVEQHLNNMVNCPVCSKAFPQEQQQGFEEHVQGHFQEEENQQDLHVRGWDLGID